MLAASSRISPYSLSLKMELASQSVSANRKRYFRSAPGTLRSTRNNSKAAVNNAGSLKDLTTTWIARDCASEFIVLTIMTHCSMKRLQQETSVRRVQHRRQISAGRRHALRGN